MGWEGRTIPELPEVETVVEALRPSVSGLTITDIMVKESYFVKLLRAPGVKYTNPDQFSEALRDAEISTVIRRGKYILMPLSNENVLVVHLGMTGKLLLQSVDEDDMGLLTDDIDQHTHFIMDLANFDKNDARPHVRLSFNDVRKFGNIWIAEDVSNILEVDIPGLKTLGPDALMVSPSEFGSILFSTQRTVKSFLLDQTKISGVGNIYADEACFVSGINPARKTQSLSELEMRKLCLGVKTVLKEGIQYGGSSTSDYVLPNGTTGSYQAKHRVYGKAGEACVICSEEIERIKIAGRSTHFCNACQPLN